MAFTQATCPHHTVIPTQAGIHGGRCITVCNFNHCASIKMDPGLRRDDEWVVMGKGVFGIYGAENVAYVLPAKAPHAASHHPVIPAQAGIHGGRCITVCNFNHCASIKMDPGLRRDDEGWFLIQQCLPLANRRQAKS